MAKKKSHAEVASDARRVPGESPLPRVRLDEFREAQCDPKVQQALHAAQEEGVQLRREGLIHD